jgi:hypothetical protein
MQSAAPPIAAFVIFGAIWLIGLVGGLYFWFGSSAANKQWLLPWFTGSTLILILGFAIFVVRPPFPFLIIFAVLGVVSSVAHVRMTTFCPRCARMIYRGWFVSRVSYCPRCGLALDQPTPATAPQ